jgi:hypothetical protein
MASLTTNAILYQPSAGDRARAYLHRSSRSETISRVLLLLLLGFVPWVLLLTLAVALYLTVIELMELDLHYLWWFWWLLLVFMTHFLGYLVLRGYAIYRRRQLAQP